MNRLLSPNFWVGVVSLAAVLGIALAIGGAVTKSPTTSTVGYVLISPVILGGVLLVVVGFPILILANRKARSSDSSDYDSDPHADGVKDE